MRYTIYTTVDITNTGQYRHEPGKEVERQQEQNFQTILQTLGMRTNITFGEKPKLLNIKGDIVGFNTTNIIHVWAFTFDTERDYPFGVDGNPLQYLEDDFDGVPYLAGLGESVEQNYEVFVTQGPARNIVFLQT